jgi:hypothetical protein
VVNFGDSQNAASVMARTAGELAKSVGSLSLALGLFSARQATRLLVAPRGRAVDSFDELTRVASGQLTGLAKTAFAVGTNLQHGIVDAVFEAAGARPRGPAPHAATSGPALSLSESVSRRLAGVRTVQSGAVDRSVPQAEFLRRLAGYHADASADGGRPERAVPALWKSEGLATSLARHLLPENTLRDPVLGSRLLPVVHVGFGSGLAQRHLFDAAALQTAFADTCATGYREFAYEGVGAMLRAYERGFFKLVSGALGFMRADTPDGPDPAGFFAGYLSRFPPPEQRLIAHGYGRILAFSHINLHDAIRRATALPPERVEPVVHGAAFAFAMMNHADLPRVLRESAIPFEPPVRAAFQNGLVYALVFLEWYVPGLLAGWTPQGSLETALVAHARQESALSLDRGLPLAFRLAAPRG